MKAILVIAVLIMGLASCKNNLVDDADLVIPEQITPSQQFMLDEINRVRTDPAGYADLRLKQEKLNSTDNGSYLYLKSLAPLKPLVFNNALNLSASNYAQFLADKNLMGHCENGTPLKRAIITGFEGASIGENIAASSGETFNFITNPRDAAIAFIKIMVIDEGVADLGHRLTMLNPTYRTVGIGFKRNTESTYVNYTVHDFGDL